MGNSQQFSRDRQAARCEEALLEVFKNQTGIRVQDHQLPAMRVTIKEACTRFGFADCNALLQTLTTQQSLSPQLEFMIAGLTVGESYFFRDARQFAFLQGKFLPELIQRKRAQNNLSIRVWSAGCADGQEIASIAILLRELLPDIEHWELHLLGTDINPEALTKAINGQYRHWSLRATSAAMTKKYFKQTKEAFALSTAVRNNLQYAWLNLIEDRFPSILTSTVMLDLILCRNVFIYLEDEVINHVVPRFAASLAMDGVLILGASDPHVCVEQELKMCEHKGVYFFRSHDSIPEPATKTRVSLNTVPTAISKKKPVQTTVKKLAPNTRPFTRENLLSIRQLELQGRWQDVLKTADAFLADGKDDNTLLQSKAMALANLGNLMQASDVCTNILHRDPDNQQTYFIKALVLLEQDDLTGAAQALRRALYIDREFLEAHRQMGLLLCRQGRLKCGIKQLTSALKLAEKADPALELVFMTGVNCERLRYILASEIIMYSNKQV